MAIVVDIVVKENGEQNEKVFKKIVENDSRQD